MSHYRLTLCLPTADDNWREAADVAMKPFRIDDETGLGEWDSWQPYGSLWVQPEFVDDPLIVPSSQWPGDPLRCDGGPKRVLDLSGMRLAAVATGREVWAAWQDAVRRHPPALPIDRLRPRHADTVAAWEAFRAQPLIREFRTRHGDEDDVFHAVWPEDDSDVVAWFGDDEERFLRREAELAVTSYALLTTDGRWLDVETTPDYRSVHRSYLDGLPDNAFVIQLSCHS